MTARSLVLVCAMAIVPVTAPAQQTGSSGGRGMGRTPAAASLGVRGFSVVLVIGGMAGPTTTATDTVPEAARKALADMKDFLPYKRYQLLDAAWMLCCGTLTPTISGRVRGPDGHDYSYSVAMLGVTESKLNLRFWMRDEEFVPVASQAKLSDVARLEHARQLAESLRERDDAELQLRTSRQKFEVGMLGAPEVEAATTRLRRAEQRTQDLRRLAGGSGGGSRGSAGRATGASAGGGARGGGGTASGQSIMDSTFSIAPGETVVIGTSRLNGDQALIALLTAAAKPGASR